MLCPSNVDTRRNADKITKHLAVNFQEEYVSRKALLVKFFKQIGAAAALSIASTALVAVPSHATVSIVMFSNASYTDTTEEDLDMAAALEDLGTVTTFDGGDGSAADWTAALTGATALVIPEAGEGDDLFGSAALSEEAADVIAEFVADGNPVIMTGAYTTTALIDHVQGVSRTWEDDEVDDMWNLNISSEELPETLPNANYAGGISNWQEWSLEDREGVTPVYIDAARSNVAVAAFAHGEGYAFYYGYDWYPDSDDVASGAREAWNEALRLGASGEFAAAVDETSGELVMGLSLDLAVGEAIEGAPVYAEASGLKPDTEWTLTLRSTPIVLDEGVVGNAGAILASVEIPAGLEPGTHTLTVVGTSSDGKTYKRVLTFVIDEGGLLESEPVLGELEEVTLADTGVDGGLLGLIAASLFAAGGIALAVRRRKA